MFLLITEQNWTQMVYFGGGDTSTACVIIPIKYEYIDVFSKIYKMEGREVSPRLWIVKRGANHYKVQLIYSEALPDNKWSFYVTRSTE